MRPKKLLDRLQTFEVFKTYFAPIVGGFILCDILSLSRNYEFFLGPHALFEPEPRNFLNMCVWRLSRSLGETPEFWFHVWIGLTIAGAVGLFWRRTRTFSAGFLWVLINTWIWSAGQTLYGVHRYIEVCLMLIVFAAIAGEETVIWPWGKIFLCLTYFNTGWAKLMSPFWRSGDVIWMIHAFYLHTRWGLATTANLAPLLPVFLLMSFVVVFAQLTSPVLLLKPRWSPVWVLVDCAVHVISAVMLRLYLFSAFLIF